MFFLEASVFQGTEKCPQYKWKQIAMCGDLSLLKKVKASFRHLENYRIEPDASEIEKRRIAA